MASTSPVAAILVTLISCLILVIPRASAQAQAPAPAASSSVNLTDILAKGGQFNKFIQLLYSTQVITRLDIQLNNTQGQGLTVFAPTDNAFDNLKSGAINSLSQQEQVELLQYHVLSQFYSLNSLETVSNPVSTQGNNQLNSGNGGDTLNITSSGNNQLNVSTGVVVAQVSNPLRQQSPLAVYTVDKVLQPPSLFAMTSAPAKAPSSSTATNASSPSGSAGGGGPVASPKNRASSNTRNVWMGIVAGFGLICMGVLL